MSDVKKAEAVVASIEAKREACLRHGTELADERANVSLDAHTGDAKARARLDEITTAIATHSSELASLDAALQAAAERVTAARQAEAKRQDKVNARVLRTEAENLVADCVAIDEAFAVIAERSVAARERLFRVHALGAPAPSNEQLDVIGKNCALTWLQKTIWARHFELLSYPHRHQFADAGRQWAQMIANAAARLGEDQKGEAA